ncbi:hypothetical protein BJ085DRAFT_32907 [Dimargaris cristalligena]|uniref:Uncharacterized protein n=1 Tax=Dimargaris cristalligena TaxID=215637 RepID=A0A4Q0A2U2_9FUNG|nr:hypothetical protein BJ085DRAFT_32907 [Dimargaris cristalligena]|eukprot:RKP40387.1 hypothetical protein BJ085DRAFT_32907 [Dimargaris cristalligena]
MAWSTLLRDSPLALARPTRGVLRYDFLSGKNFGSDKPLVPFMGLQDGSAAKASVFSIEERGWKYHQRWVGRGTARSFSGLADDRRDWRLDTDEKYGETIFVATVGGDGRALKSPWSTSFTNSRTEPTPKCAKTVLTTRQGPLIMAPVATF